MHLNPRVHFAPLPYPIAASTFPGLNNTTSSVNLSDGGGGGPQRSATPPWPMGSAFLPLNVRTKTSNPETLLMERPDEKSRASLEETLLHLDTYAPRGPARRVRVT